MLAEFEFASPAYLQLAPVIRAADRNAHDLAPRSAGLLAWPDGLSWFHGGDCTPLQAALAFHDALDPWGRDGADGMDGTEEIHVGLWGSDA